MSKQITYKEKTTEAPQPIPSRTVSVVRRAEGGLASSVPQSIAISSHRGILQILWRRVGIILAVTLAAVTLTVEYLQLVQPLYSASSSLYIEQAAPKIMSDTPGTESINSNYLNTQVELIKAGPILAMALKQLEIQRLPVFRNIEGRPFDYLKKSLMVDIGKKDDIITVSLETPYPNDSAAIVNGVVDSYISFSSQRKQSTAVEVLKILEKEKDRLTAELTKEQKDIRDFVDNAGPFGTTGEKSLVIQQQLTELGHAYMASHLQRLDLESNFLPDHPAVITARRHEAETAAAYNDLIQRVQQMETSAATYQQLSDGSERTERQLDTVDDRMKEVNIVQDAGALNIDILERATTTDVPSHPRPLRTLAIGGVLGLLLGGMIAILLDLTDDKLRSVEETAAVLLPVLTVVPKIKGRRRVHGLAAHLDPTGRAAEAFRSLRSSILFATGKKTVLITSPLRGEGKSTTAANTAISLAQAGRKVLLMDADLREPNQHRIFQTPGGRGLVGFLSTGASEEDPAIAKTAVNNLDLLQCGPIPQNPSELLNSDVFEDLLSTLRDRYDYIVVDSPPVLMVTDASILAAICDLTILVVKHERTRRKTMISALERLAAFDANVLGVLLNGVKKKWSDRHHPRRPKPTEMNQLVSMASPSALALH